MRIVREGSGQWGSSWKESGGDGWNSDGGLDQNSVRGLQFYAPHKKRKESCEGKRAGDGKDE